MGQATRQPKYDKFWTWARPLKEGSCYVNAIDMLLRTLTDKQLDEILADLEAQDDPA